MIGMAERAQRSRYMATRNVAITVSFIGGAFVALLLLAALGALLVRALRWLPLPRLVPARLAISNIVRPGSPVRAVIIAFGLGLSVLVTVSVSESNLGRQIDARVTEDAPAYFYRYPTASNRTLWSLGAALTGSPKLPNADATRSGSTVGRHTEARHPRRRVGMILRGDRAPHGQKLLQQEAKLSPAAGGPPTVRATTCLDVERSSR